LRECIFDHHDAIMPEGACFYLKIILLRIAV
jgi:hypothetical protein